MALGTAERRTLRARLRDREQVIGVSLATPAPDLVEIAGYLGYDFVTFDMEHECIDDRDVPGLVRAAVVSGVTPIARVALDPSRILRLLDAGVQGIHIPRCNTAADVSRLVECCLLHPAGKRTFYNLGRSGRFAVGVDDELWAEQANEDLVLVVTVEEAEAVENLSAILAEDRIDTIYIGKKDLWQSLGMPPQARVDEVARHVADATRLAGKSYGLTLRLLTDVSKAVNDMIAWAPGMVAVPLFDLVINAGKEVKTRLQSSTDGPTG